MHPVERLGTRITPSRPPSLVWEFEPEFAPRRTPFNLGDAIPGVWYADRKVGPVLLVSQGCGF